MAVLGLGAVDTAVPGLTPVDPHVDVLGYSSDQTVVDITAAEALEPGDVVRFVPNYEALATAMSSPYLFVQLFEG